MSEELKEEWGLLVFKVLGWGGVGGGSGGDDTANNFLWSEWHDVDDVLAKVHSVLTLLRGSVIIAHLFK